MHVSVHEIKQIQCLLRFQILLQFLALLSFSNHLVGIFCIMSQKESNVLKLVDWLHLNGTSEFCQSL